jgi:hypothetical protein
MTVASDPTLPGSSRSIEPDWDLIPPELPLLSFSSGSFSSGFPLDTSNSTGFDLFQPWEDKYPIRAHLHDDPFGPMFSSAPSMPDFDANLYPVRYASKQSGSITALSSVADSEKVSHHTK